MKSRKFSGPTKLLASDAGMTLIEVSLALGFFALFVMALLTVSAGVERMVRGYTCRILSGDPSATGPERGCVGQSDEVSATGVASIKLANQAAFQVLRDQLIGVGEDSFAAIQIKSFNQAALSAQARHSELEQKCLWEKLAMTSGGKFAATRNYWIVNAASASPSLVVQQPSTQRLPQPSDRLVGSTYWFVRAGRLIGETKTPTGEVITANGLSGIEDLWLSVDPPSGQAAISGAEASELLSADKQITNAPDRQWGLLNQVCLFKAGSSLPNLFLLSGERGQDLGSNSMSNINPVFFGRAVGANSRQPQPRLLFYVP